MGEDNHEKADTILDEEPLVLAVSRSGSSLRAGVFPYLCGACRDVTWIWPPRIAGGRTKQGIGGPP
jgi:hypothetical protein